MRQFVITPSTSTLDPKAAPGLARYQVFTSIGCQQMESWFGSFFKVLVKFFFEKFGSGGVHVSVKRAVKGVSMRRR